MYECPKANKLIKRRKTRCVAQKIWKKKFCYQSIEKQYFPICFSNLESKNFIIKTCWRCEFLLIHLFYADEKVNYIIPYWIKYKENLKVYTIVLKEGIVDNKAKSFRGSLGEFDKFWPKAWYKLPSET